MSDSLSTTSIHPSWDSLLENTEDASSGDRARVSQLFRDGAEVDAVELLITQVDDSNYSLNDWIVALASFDEWLVAKESKARPLETMLGYVHCCTMTSAETLAAPALDRLLKKMLDEFGFDAAQDAEAG